MSGRTQAKPVWSGESNRAWMNRAYALGMGLGTAALVLFPVYLITREPPSGSDIDARRVVYVVVKELGPVVKLLSSATLIEGGIEVVLDVAIYDPARGQQGRFTTHWRHGGAGVVKGVASLPDDMRAALATALGVRAD